MDDLIKRLSYIDSYKTVADYMMEKINEYQRATTVSTE